MGCTKRGKLLICMVDGQPLHPYSYDYGLRFCTSCRRVFDVEKRFCPCCNLQLRTKPRGKIHKLKLRKRSCNEVIRF